MYQNCQTFSNNFHNFFFLLAKVYLNLANIMGYHHVKFQNKILIFHEEILVLLYKTFWPHSSHCHYSLLLDMFHNNFSCFPVVNRKSNQTGYLVARKSDSGLTWKISRDKKWDKLLRFGVLSLPRSQTITHS